MFRIDKSFVESMNLNKEVVVITNKEILEDKPKPKAPPQSPRPRIPGRSSRKRPENRRKS